MVWYRKCLMIQSIKIIDKLIFFEFYKKKKSMIFLYIKDKNLNYIIDISFHLSWININKTMISINTWNENISLNENICSDPSETWNENVRTARDMKWKTYVLLHQRTKSSKDMKLKVSINENVCSAKVL